ncbi:hypothetical protein NL676_037263 [Syzygium grande]|nr:hypothetical protein NL676_037263 [Syzygium grande]
MPSKVKIVYSIKKKEVKIASLLLPGSGKTGIVVLPEKGEGEGTVSLLAGGLTDSLLLTVSKTLQTPHFLSPFSGAKLVFFRWKMV